MGTGMFTILGCLYLLLFCTVLVFIFVNILCETNTEEEFTNEEISPDRIHIYMSFDEKYDWIGDTTSEINNNYSKKWGFHFHKMRPPPLGNTYVPHYGRYFNLIELMNKYTDPNIYFIYIDGDASVINKNIDLRKWIPNANTHILFGNECKTTYIDKVRNFFLILIYGISINSGVFIVKNSDWSRNFIEKIVHSTTCSKVWNKKDLNIGFYDQSCILKLFKKLPHTEKKHIRVIPHNKAIQQYKEDISYVKKYIDFVPILHTTRNKHFYSKSNPQLPKLLSLTQ